MSILGSPWVAFIVLVGHGRAGVFLWRNNNCITRFANTLLWTSTIIWGEIHDQSSVVSELASSEWFGQVIRHHIVGRTEFYTHFLPIDKVRDKEIFDIQVPGSFSNTWPSIFRQLDCALIVLIYNVVFDIMTLSINEVPRINSDSVELLVFTFCFVDTFVTAPLPRVIVAPV
jgi:hypothetical protein